MLHIGPRIIRVHALGLGVLQRAMPKAVAGLAIVDSLALMVLKQMAKEWGRQAPPVDHGARFLPQGRAGSVCHGITGRTWILA